MSLRSAHSRKTASNSTDRLENYRKLLRELAFEQRKHDKAASADVKRRWKQIQKAQRAIYKKQDRSG